MACTQNIAFALERRTWEWLDLICTSLKIIKHSHGLFLLMKLWSYGEEDLQLKNKYIEP